MIELLRRGFDEGVDAGAIAEALRRHDGEPSSEDLAELAAVLEEYLRSVPDALGAALAMTKDPQCGRAVAFATGTILTYIFDEEDLLPEASFGTIGMIDDAYLVHGFVAALSRMFPYAAPSMDTYDAPDGRANDVVESLLPEGIAQSLLRTCESTIQVSQALFPAGPGADASGLAYEPQIRVTEAIGTNRAAAPR